MASFAAPPPTPAVAPAQPPPAAPRFVVAIDGLSGSGKSTVARDLADRLGADWLDTGAMYRAVAWLALEVGADPRDEAAVAALLEGFEVDVSPEKVLLSSPAVGSTNQDITQAIRIPQVTQAASAVAQNLAVRSHLQQQQRAWVSSRPKAVVEGRDIGTAVFPQADHKFYLTASAQVRASRRAQEQNSQASQELSDMAHRDQADQSRKHSPLLKAGDALEVDTSELTAAQTVELLLGYISAAAPDPAADPAAPGPAAADPAAPDPADTSRFNPHDFPVAKKYGTKHSLSHRLGYLFVRALAVLIGRIYFRYRVRGAGKLPRTGPVIVAPGGHRSNLDTPFVGMAIRRAPQYMAKDSLFKSPFWARFIHFFCGFPVARDKLDRRALKLALAALERGEVLVVFPEGSRQQGPKLQPLFEGVAWLSAKSGVPVLPLGVGGTERVMPIGVKWPRPHRVRMIYGELLAPPGSVGQADPDQTGTDPTDPDPAPTRQVQRVPREEMDAFTEELTRQLQQLFDQAQQWAGTPNE